MDSDHNPSKKNRFNRDAYLTQFRMQVDEDQIDLKENTVVDKENDVEIASMYAVEQDTFSAHN